MTYSLRKWFGEGIFSLDSLYQMPGNHRVLEFGLKSALAHDITVPSLRDVL